VLTSHFDLEIRAAALVFLRGRQTVRGRFLSTVSQFIVAVYVSFCRCAQQRRFLPASSSPPPPALTLCARDADVCVQSTWTTFGSLWAPRDVMVKEIRIFSTHGPNQLLSRVAASRNVSIPENSNSRSHNSRLTALSLFSKWFLPQSEWQIFKSEDHLTPKYF
jgi:hypothetical protein